MKITEANWHSFARAIAYPAEPEEHSPASVERLMYKLLPYIRDVKGVHPQFKAQNGIKIIEFRKLEERTLYDNAIEEFYKEKAKIEGGEYGEGNQGVCLLAALTIFRKSSEAIRAEWIADELHKSYLEGYAPTAAVSFKTTITKIVGYLINKYGYTRDDISIIWGGQVKKVKKKKKKSDLMSAKEMENFLRNAEMSGLSEEDIADILGEEVKVTEKVETIEDSKMRMGNQSKSQRQEEIDRFQSGKSKFCIFTFKAGGVGLSLHHTDEQTEYKVKRTKNNWAVVDDIKNCPTRPRRCILAPVYSAVELVQGLGRCPRLTSLSDTEQVIAFYKDTIEVSVAAIVSMKLRCLQKVVRQRESWESVIINNDRHIENEAVKMMSLNTTVDNATTVIIEPDEDDILLGGNDSNLEDDEED